jgi:uncharacterized membrane protein
MRPRRLRRGSLSPTLLTIALPALLAGGLAAIGLGERSLWLDEGASFAIASQHGAALWRAIAHDGGNMSAYYLLLHAIVGLFGTSLAALRVASVLANAATAAITAALGLRLFGWRAGLAAGVLLAVGLPFVFWGQDARGYALMVTAASGSFLALAAVLDAAQESDRVPWGALAAYGLSLLLAVYLSFDAVLVVPAQLAVAAVVRRRALIALIGALVPVAVACVPLLVLATERGSSQLFWVPSPSLSVLGQAALTLTSAGMPPNFHHSQTTVATLAVTVLGLLAALVAGGVSLRRRYPDAPGWEWQLVVAWLLVPAALATAAALAGQPIELARSSILLAPAVALLLAWGLVRSRLPRWAGIGGFAVLVALRALQLGPSYGTSPENWKAAARYVLAQPGPSCVAFYPQDGRMAFDYYVRSAGDRRAVARLRPVLPSAPWAQVRPYVERYTVPDRRRLAAIVRSCPRLWFIASHQGQRHGPAVSRRNYARYHRFLRELDRSYRRHRERSFGYAAEVRVTLLRR